MMHFLAMSAIFVDVMTVIFIAENVLPTRFSVYFFESEMPVLFSLVETNLPMLGHFIVTSESCLPTRFGGKYIAHFISQSS